MAVSRAQIAAMQNARRRQLAVRRRLDSFTLTAGEGDDTIGYVEGVFGSITTEPNPVRALLAFTTGADKTRVVISGKMIDRLKSVDVLVGSLGLTPAGDPTYDADLGATVLDFTDTAVFVEGQDYLISFTDKV